MIRTPTHRLQLTLCHALLGLALACGSPHPATSVLVLRGATLIDGTGAPPVANVTVVVKGNRIFQVASGGQPTAPAGARVFDLAGKWIIPGLIDAHVHFNASGGLYSRPDEYDLRALVPFEDEIQRIRDRVPVTLNSFICAGVTSVVALGDPRFQFEIRETAAATVRAPRVAVVGPFMSSAPVSEFFFWTREDPGMIQVRNPDEAKRLVRDLAARKVDLIKTGYIANPGVSLRGYVPILEAIINESHSHGLRVVVHAEELAAATEALRAGADVLAHTVKDQVIGADFVGMASQRGIVSVTTLWASRAGNQLLTHGIDLLPVERECGDPEVVVSWNDVARIPKAKKPPIPTSVVDGDSPRVRQIMLANLKRLFDGGVAIAVGSDATNLGVLPGGSFHRELLLMAEAGIPPMQIIVAATRNGARVLGRQADIGTVEAGKLADIVVLNASPLADIRNASNIYIVVKDGQVIERGALVVAH